LTALAGVLGPASTGDREAAARSILHDQRIFSSGEQEIASSNRCTLGISPHPAWKSSPLARSGEWLAVADVRLDNRGELLRRLGADAAGATDAQILLLAWRSAGEASLNWIVGDFALAIYDPERGELVLARDLAGQFPLFLAQSGDRTGFASMPSGLRSFIGQLDLNKPRLALTLCDVGHDDYHSHFAKVQRVLPGEIVRIGKGEISRRFYWHVPSRAQHRNGRDWVEEYRQTLDAAVADRCRGFAPIATHLSSGWDSSAVTATTAKLAGPANVVAFTSAPLFRTDLPEPLRRLADESPIASTTAEFASVQHVIVRELPPFLEAVRRQSLLCEEPILSVPNLAWTVEIRRLAAEHGAQRLLAGTLGNLTLNRGGLYVLSEWLRLKHPMLWLRQAVLAYRRSDVRIGGIVYNSVLPWLPAPFSRFLERSVIGVRTLEDISFLRPEWLTAVQGAYAKTLEANVNLPENALARIRALDPGMLRKGGLADHGVLELDPLGDRRCIDLALGLPPRKRYWNGVARPLARAALADRVPPEVLNLRGRGLQGADWALRFTKTDAHEMLEEIAGNSTAADLLDIDRMRTAIERWPSKSANAVGLVSEFRLALLGALSCGLFACVHEARAKSGG